MSPEIRELDAETRDRIAAGEVVERPASVVKELLENALDADAGRIDVAVEAGGTDRIVVSDDGVGMTESDARLAVEEHTTSKLEDVSDLDSIGTLGFRGEALHAIGSVARLRVETKPRGGGRGTELVVEGGDVVSCGPTGCPEGTTVEVTDLFGNVPARRKYLKTEATEFDHVARIVTGYALARPDVAVSLSRDGRETFATAGDGDRKSAVMAVYGRDVAASMVPVEYDGESGEPVAGVEGLVSHPETNRAGSEYVTTLVDGRYVTAGAVREAVVDAYGDGLAPDRYPFAVVDLRLPPGGVDVNVHPRKLEVLFAEEAAVKRAVTEAVGSALSEAGLLRSRAPRGRSAPEQTEISPGGTEATDGAVEASGGAADASDGKSGDDATVDGAADRSVEGASEPNADGAAEGAVDDAVEPNADGTGDPTTDDVTERPSPATESPSGADSESTSVPGSESTSGASSRASSGASSRDAPSESRSPAAGSTPDSRPPRSAARDHGAQTTLDGDDAHTRTRYDTVPDLRVLGQFQDTYIVAEADDGLVLIDQHAADERINYERLKQRFEGDTTTQTLAEPIRLGLTARESALFDAYADALSRLGFHANRVDDRTIAVTTLPALVADAADIEVVRDVLADFVSGEERAERTVEAVADELLADMACYPSITGNTSLREGTVEGLLEELDGCENPWACPHGRPVLIHLDSEEIADRFERDYPGH